MKPRRSSGISGGRRGGNTSCNRCHTLFADQLIEPLRHVFAEAGTIRMGYATAGEPHKIHKQEHSRPSRSAGTYTSTTRTVGSSNILFLRAWLSIVIRLMEHIDPKNLRTRLYLWFCRYYKRTTAHRFQTIPENGCLWV
jgi:hypothetical protein